MQIVTLIVAMLAVTRLSMLLVDDRLLLGFRQWVIHRWGEDSLPAYLVLCNWCMSMWVAVPIMPATVLITWGVNKYTILLSLLSIPVASLVAGVISVVVDALQAAIRYLSKIGG